MLKYLLSRQLDKLETTFNYDASYLREVLRVNTRSALLFVLGTRAYDRSAAPREALAGASIYSTMREDCGPCVQIGVDIATANGVDPQVLRAIVAGDEAAMGDTARLAYSFARASLDRDVEACHPLRNEIVRRWGDKALVAISLAMVSSRMYPTLKFAMGHGVACARVRIAGETIAPLHAAG